MRSQTSKPESTLEKNTDNSLFSKTDKPFHTKVIELMLKLSFGSKKRRSDDTLVLLYAEVMQYSSEKEV